MLLREIEVHDNEPQTIKQGAIEGLIVWEVVNGLLLLFLAVFCISYLLPLLFPLGPFYISQNTVASKREEIKSRDHNI